MIALWIVLAILALLILLILFGSLKVNIVCREKLRVVASVCGIRFTLISDKESKQKPPKDLERCHNPDALLRRELRRQKREAEKAERKRRRAEKKAAKKAAKKKQVTVGGTPVTPNLKENLEMILSLVKRLYYETQGKIKIHFRKMHIRVGTDDAAKTAVLYGVILQIASFLLNFVEEHFAHIKRNEGDVSIEPDYVSGTCGADIDIVCSVKIRKALVILLHMLSAYNDEQDRTYRKAARRIRKKRGKAA